MARDEIWDAMKEATKRRRKNWTDNNMRAAANLDDGGWTKHSKYHWSRDVNGERLDFWPSTRKYQYRGKVRQGDPRKVFAPQ